MTLAPSIAGESVSRLAPVRMKERKPRGIGIRGAQLGFSVELANEVRAAERDGDGQE